MEALKSGSAPPALSAQCSSSTALLPHFRVKTQAKTMSSSFSLRLGSVPLGPKRQIKVTHTPNSGPGGCFFGISYPVLFLFSYLLDAKITTARKTKLHGAGGRDEDKSHSGDRIKQ